MFALCCVCYLHVLPDRIAERLVLDEIDVERLGYFRDPLPDTVERLANCLERLVEGVGDHPGEILHRPAVVDVLLPEFGGWSAFPVVHLGDPGEEQAAFASCVVVA